MAHQLTRASLGAAVLVVGVAAAYSAPAKPAPAQSIAVNFGDLDLSRTEGIARLYQRIRKAAREVCNPQGLTIYVPQMRSYHECYRLTVADATARVDALIRERSRAARP